MKKFILLIILLFASNSFAASGRDVRKFVVNRANELTAMEKDSTIPGYSTVFRENKNKKVIRRAYKYILIRDCSDKFSLKSCIVAVHRYYSGKKCNVKQIAKYATEFLEISDLELILNANEWSSLTREKALKSQE